MTDLRRCPGYHGTDYRQEPHLLPNDPVNFYEGKSYCRPCYRAYAKDWRAGRKMSERPYQLKSGPLADGVEALKRLLERAGYPSVVAAVAEHTIFLPTETVAQTGGAALFRTIRRSPKGGEVIGLPAELPDGRVVLIDDNQSAVKAFWWAARQSRVPPEMQTNHVWPQSRDPDSYTALWNLCATPTFLAKTTDGSNYPEVKAAVRFHAYKLYGCLPSGVDPPAEPAGYADLIWAPCPPPVPDLNVEFRRRFARSRADSNRAARCAREVGWLFSNWLPDPTI
jgi:hypothetical protein